MSVLTTFCDSGSREQPVVIFSMLQDGQKSVMGTVKLGLG